MCGHLSLEMPSSGKSKIWRLCALHYPSPPQISMTTPPPTPTPRKAHFDPVPNLSHGNCLGHYVKSYMRHRPSQFALNDRNGKIVFVSDKRHAKMPQKPIHESKKIRILRENGINSKLKHSKAHNSI